MTENGAGTRPIRMVTLNAWGIRGDWPMRRERLVEGFRTLAPDLVTLQEVILTESYDQARDVLGEDYHVVHQRARESDGQGISTLSRWPLGTTFEVDLHLTERTRDFACTSVVAEVLAPPPVGRIWLVNNLPSWQPAYELERQLQAVVTARAVESLLVEAPGHVIVAGDFDADPDAGSLRFWTGRDALDGTSVCYRDAWESCRGGEEGDTFAPDNPFSADRDWPFRRIDYILVRMAEHDGPSLDIRSCRRIFDGPATVASDHYGLVADLAVPE